MKKSSVMIIFVLISFFLFQSVAKAGLFTITVINENFCVDITDPATIQLAYENLAGMNHKITTGIVASGDGDFNQPWSWHLIPDSVRLVDIAVEICDGRPSFVEQHLADWLGRSFCPWHSRVSMVGCIQSTTTSSTTTTTSIISTTTSISCLPLRSACEAGGMRCCVGSCMGGFCRLGGGCGWRCYVLGLSSNLKFDLASVVIVTISLIASFCIFKIFASRV